MASLVFLISVVAGQIPDQDRCQAVNAIEPPECPQVM